MLESTEPGRSDSEKFTSSRISFGSRFVPRIFSSALKSLLTFLLLSLGTGELGAQGADEGTLIGAVSALETGQPITNAEVRLQGTDFGTTTNRSGRFQLSRVPAGTYTVIIDALGYRSSERGGITVRRGETTRIEIDVELQPLSLERIVVSAAKEALSVGEIASQTAIVNTQEARRRGEVELVDVVENTPGVTVSTQAGSFQSIEMRGMPRQGSEFTSTLLLIDGVPQTDSRNSARIINLPLDDASAIEIVRGPNSALYGRTAVGGAINIQTSEPTTEPRAVLSLEAGSFDRLKADVRASGPVSDWGGYDVSWSRMGNEGFYTGDPEYAVDQNSAFGKFTFTPDDASSGMVSLASVVSDNSLPTSVPIIDGRLLSEIEPGFDEYANINLPTANYHQENLRFTLNYERRLSDHVSFTEIFGYRNLEFDFQETGDIIGAPFDLDEDRLTSYPFSMLQEEEIFYQEGRFRITPELGIENSVIAGFSYEDNSGSRIGDLIYSDPATFGIPINFLDPQFPDRSEWQYFQFGGDEYGLQSLGFYAQARVSPVSWLQLTAAGRYDRLNMENVKTLAEGAPSISRSYDAFSPKVSSTFNLLSDRETEALGRASLNVYATYSEAFLPPRSPGGLNPVGEQPNLVPEDVRNYEGGIKGTFWDQKVALDASYFQMRRNGIVVQTRVGPFFEDSNAGEQDFEGIEFGLTWLPMERLSLRANGALYQHRFGDFVIQREGGDEVLTGHRLPLVPDENLNLGAEFELTEEIGVTGNVKYVGSRYIDQGNTFLLDSHSVIDASVFYERGPFSLTLAAQNLTDEVYFNYGDIFNGEAAAPAPPRQLLLRTSYTFR